MIKREAFFLPADNGERFCLYTPCQGANELGVVLYIHPFAEEMNKSRRMVALQSRALATAGYGVLQIDLHGCGDSSDDFGDASWDSWVEDIVNACHWLCDRSSAPLWFWGLRAGCLLAASAAVNLEKCPNFLFWQPALAGKLLLQQFLRLKMAGELIGNDTKGVTEQLRRQLAEGGTIEVAGYRLSPALTNGLEAAELQLPPNAGRVEWIEISPRADATLALPSSKRLTQWQGAGLAVRSQVVSGPSFWQTSEIEEAPALIKATLDALGGPAAL